MRRRDSILAFALVATVALAGCGDDNSSNDNGGGNPTPTTTPVVATPTATQQPPTVTPTDTGPTVTGGPETPTPTPTTATTTGCSQQALTISVTSGTGSELDTGYTGIAHDQETISDSKVTIDLNCDPNLVDCTLDGSSLVGTNFGAPLPLSSGGVPVCVINEFREGVTGTYNCEDGCGVSAVKLTSFVFLVQDIAKPCPTCVGDTTPNDGNKDGTCDGGTAPGAPCDVGGVSPDFGSTSNDCLPTGSSVGELEIDINPLTTGTVDVDSSINCASPFFPAGTCYCPGQIAANNCTDGVCTNGVCAAGPIDGLCSNQQFRSCISGTGTANCEDVFPGSGTCIDKNRPCFTNNITRTGQCGLDAGTLVGFFCVPATRAPAINTTAGLPGPGALSLPGTSVRAPR